MHDTSSTVDSIAAPLDYSQASMSVRAKHALLCLPALVAPLFLPLLLREQILVGVVPHTHIGSGA